MEIKEIKIIPMHVLSADIFFGVQIENLDGVAEFDDFQFDYLQNMNHEALEDLPGKYFKFIFHLQPYLLIEFSSMRLKNPIK